MVWFMTMESDAEVTVMLNPFPWPGSVSKKYSPLLTCEKVGKETIKPKRKTSLVQHRFLFILMLEFVLKAGSS